MRELYLRFVNSEKKFITEEQAQSLRATKSSIKLRSALIWAEHCSECAMPACFSYCEYYSPRMDLKCQRFENGISSVFTGSHMVPEAMSIVFKKWGKLEASGIAKFTPPQNLFVLKFINTHIETVLRIIPLPYFMKLFSVKVFKRVLHMLSAQGKLINVDAQDSHFLIETINNEEKEISVSLTVREVSNPTRFYQKLVDIPTGYHQTAIDLHEFKGISLSERCLYQIEPTATYQKAEIIFGIVEFVVMDNITTETFVSDAPKVKAVIWDLDNTLWDGTLVEDGVDGITLRPKMVQTIMKFDDMGILNTIASKNNYDDAMVALKRFGLEQYFIYPQVSWNPKSNAIKIIQKSLNISLDTMIFIDDQIFERTEVSAMLPGIRTFSDKDVAGLLSFPEFHIPITNESKKRRKMYQENIVREQALETSSDDYMGFLKSCNIELNFESLNEQTIDRVHELSQRTNQMNFSGNRYTKAQLIDTMQDNTKKTFVISCKDRFGEYGIVGFAIIDDSDIRLVDLMFSCRIQAKQVEHTFIKHILAFYKGQEKSCFYACYRPTPKNAQSGKVFSDIGFSLENEADGLQDLKFDLTHFTLGDPVLTVIDKTLLYKKEK